LVTGSPANHSQVTVDALMRPLPALKVALIEEGTQRQLKGMHVAQLAGSLS